MSNDTEPSAATAMTAASRRSGDLPPSSLFQASLSTICSSPRLFVNGAGQELRLQLGRVGQRDLAAHQHRAEAVEDLGPPVLVPLGVGLVLRTPRAVEVVDGVALLGGHHGRISETRRPAMAKEIAGSTSELPAE